MKITILISALWFVALLACDSESGALYLSSLVSNNRTIGDWYLEALYRTGEFVRPRNALELREVFGKAFDQQMSYAEKGNMAFVRVHKKIRAL